MRKIIVFVILYTLLSPVTAREKNALDYELKSKISDHNLICELESLNELDGTNVESSTPKVKFRIERASKSEVYMSPVWEGEGQMPYNPKLEILGFYDIDDDDAMWLLANSVFGKLVIRYNHIAQDKSVQDGETTLSISAMTAERNQLGRIYAGIGFCKIDKEAKSDFPFKDSEIPPQNYSHAKMYYYPDLKMPKHFMGISLGGREISTIVKEHKGTVVKHSNWKQVFKEPKTRKYAQALCYIPRHLLVFFDEKNAPLSYVEVCLQCKGYRSSDFKTKLDIHEFAKVVNAANLPISPEGISLEKYIQKDKEAIEYFEARRSKEQTK
ncbi:hypothetical protein [Aliikangiella sp. IMCC44359]|uniref:hypothetical protein n=1 Tax=Aliikangiella sp. IMCC44359 TaxID=3459125 RepID=UPI00403A8D05